jgi:hypothetical protein
MDFQTTLLGVDEVFVLRAIPHLLLHSQAPLTICPYPNATVPFYYFRSSNDLFYAFYCLPCHVMDLVFVILATCTFLCCIVLQVCKDDIQLKAEALQGISSSPGCMELI